MPPYGEGQSSVEQPVASLSDALRKFRGYKEFQDWIRTQPAERRERTVREVVEELLSSLEEGGARERPGMEALTNVQEPLLVRSEDPLRVLAALEGKKDLQLMLDPSVGGRYANSVQWSPQEGSRGLQNAFTEGLANLSGTMTIIGVRQGPDLEVTLVDGSASPIPGYDRSLVRSATGVVHPEDWRFVAVRTPIHVFPESRMNAEERIRLEEYKETLEETGKRPSPEYIFRSYSFGKTDEESPMPMQ